VSDFRTPGHAKSVRFPDSLLFSDLASIRTACKVVDIVDCGTLGPNKKAFKTHSPSYFYSLLFCAVPSGVRSAPMSGTPPRGPSRVGLSLGGTGDGTVYGTVCHLPYPIYPTLLRGLGTVKPNDTFSLTPYYHRGRICMVSIISDDSAGR